MKEMVLELTPGPDENIKIFNLYLVTLPSFNFLFHWVFLAAHELSLFAGSRNDSLVVPVASLVAEHGLWGSWASVVVEQGLLSCSVACGIFPEQGSYLCPLHWQVDS